MTDEWDFPSIERSSVMRRPTPARRHHLPSCRIVFLPAPRDGRAFSFTDGAHTHTPDDAVSLGLIARRMSRKSPPTSEIDIKPQATPSRRRPQRRACEGAALVKSRPAPRAVGTGSPRPLCSAPRGRSAKQRVSGRSLARGGGARVPVEPVLRLARGDRATRNRIRGEPAWAGLVWFERWAARGE